MLDLGGREEQRTSEISEDQRDYGGIVRQVREAVENPVRSEADGVTLYAPCSLENAGGGCTGILDLDDATESQTDGISPVLNRPAIGDGEGHPASSGSLRDQAERWLEWWISFGG